MEFVETPLFTRRVAELLPDDEYRVLQDLLRSHPESGRVIVGTGGARKIRWALGEKGKRGGVRVVYYFATPDGLIYMLLVYAKREQEDLTAEQRRGFRSIIAKLK